MKVSYSEWAGIKHILKNQYNDVFFCAPLDTLKVCQISTVSFRLYYALKHEHKANTQIWFLIFLV